MEYRPLGTARAEAKSRGALPFGCTVVLGIAVLAIVAAIVIPNLIKPKYRGQNQTAAIATLRNLARVQEEFQASGKCDLDGDWIGEFGTFGELTGTEGGRADAAGLVRGKTLNPPVLSAALAAVDANGVVTKSGYCFRIFLPRKGGGAVNEGEAMGWAHSKSPAPPATTEPDGKAPGTPFTGPVDIDSSEERWCAYAWPMAFGNSGSTVFFVDQGGDVLEMDNPGGRYSGVLSGPAWDAAIPADGKATWSPSPEAEEYSGRDGNVWKATN